MGRNWASKVIPVLAALAYLWGCERGEDASSESVSATTNVVAAAPAKPLSPDMQAAIKMREALDSGDVREALVGARRLMHSKERDVRSEALTVFTWIGKRVLPELAEMMRDADADIAQRALSGWEQSFGELNYDFERTKFALLAVSNLTDRAFIDAVLLQVVTLDRDSALPILQELIIQYKGTHICIAARAMFEHIAGEAWSSTNRTQKIVHKKNREDEL